MDIVQNILKIAKEKKTTDQQMVKLLKTNSSKIYDWKVGKSRPSANDVKVLAEYFNVSVAYLLGETDRPEPEAMDQELVILNRAARKATPQQREQMMALLKSSFEDLFDDEP